MKLFSGLSHKKDRLWQQVMLLWPLIPLVLLAACGSDTRGMQTTLAAQTALMTTPIPKAIIAAGPLTHQTQVSIYFHHRVNKVSWSPNGQYVAALVSVGPDVLSPSYSDTLEVVNARSSKIIGEESFAKMQGDITQLRWSHNSTLLAFQVDMYLGTRIVTAVEVWSLQSQHSLWQQTLTRNLSSYDMVWSPDSQFLAIDFGSQASSNGIGLGIYAATDGKSQAFNVKLGQQFGIAWSPDSTAIAAVLSEHLVLWNFRTNQTTLSIPSDNLAGDLLVWSPNGKLLEIEGNQTIETLDIATGKNLCSLQSVVEGLSSLFWSSDNQHLYLTAGDGAAQMWNAITCALVVNIRGQMARGGTPLPEEWSPNGRYIAAASTNDTVSIYDTTTSTTLLTFAGHTQQINSIDWSPASTLMASASSDGTVQIWQASKGG